MTQTAKTEADEKEWNLRIIPKKEQHAKPTRQKWNVLQGFENVDFRLAHDGLGAMCREKGINLAKLEQGNCVVFFNSAKNAIKIAFSDEDIFHHRESRKLEIRVLDKIMARLNSTGKISYPEALRDFIVERLKSRGIVDESELKRNPKIN